MRHGAFAHVNGVIELECIAVFDSLADLTKLWVIGVKRLNDIGITTHRANSGLNFRGVSSILIWKLMRVHSRAEISGFCHKFGRTMTGCAIGIVHRRHHANVLFVALVTGKIRWYVWLVKFLFLMTG